MNKKSFKIIAFLLAVITIFSGCFVMATAKDSSKLALVVDTVSAKADDTVKIKIVLKNNTSLASLKFSVMYDNVLTLKNVELSKDFGDYITTPTPYKNPQTISLISPLKDIKTNGTLATLTFKVDAKITDTYKANITIRYDQDDIFDGNFKNLSLDVIDGAVNIIGKTTTQSFTVTLNSNDGTGVISKITVPVNKTTKLTTPTRSGYTCLGWSTDKNAVSPSYKCGSDYKPSSNVDLYAVWAKNNSKVAGVTINDVSLHYKDSVTIKPEIKVVNNAKYEIKWSSSDESVAQVDNAGKIIATKRGKGTATITCVVTDQFGNTVKDTCKVEVSLTAWQWIKTYILFGWIWY